jgi:hypothetical protein
LAIILALGFILAMPAESQFTCGGSADGTNGLNGGGATANGSANNFAGGTNAVAGGVGSGNAASGVQAHAHGDRSSNTATGFQAIASGDNSFNTATGHGATASGDSSNNIATGTFANASGGTALNPSANVRFQPCSADQADHRQFRQLYPGMETLISRATLPVRHRSGSAMRSLRDTLDARARQGSGDELFPAAPCLS